MHVRQQRILVSVALVVLLAACGSGGGGTPSGQASPPPISGSTPATAVPTSPASSVESTPAGGSPVVSAPASVTAGGAVPRPAGTTCEWLDKATIDATLGLSVGKAVPSVGAGNDICTWLSKAPAGGITLAIVDGGDFAGMLANYQKLPGGRLVPGLGVHAVALFVTGQKAPLPNSHAQVFVDYGGWALSVDVSGPTVTVEEAAALAVAAVQ